MAISNQYIANLVKTISSNMTKKHRNRFELHENSNADNHLIDEYLASITNSEEFKEWFGNSQLVDDNGKPLVLYHGDFHNDGEYGYHDFRYYNTWFTPDKAMASHYGNVTSCFVRADKVYMCDAKGYPWTNIPIRIVPELKLEPYDEEYPNDTSVNDIAHVAIDAGYDAAWIKNVDDDEVADQIFVKGPIDAWTRGMS